MTRTLWFGSGVIAGVAISVGASGAIAAGGQSGAATAGKNTSRVILENARVRVKEAIFVPADQHPGMHTHTLPHVGVVIEGGTLTFRYPDGKVEKADVAAGSAGYRDANVTHEAISSGKNAVKVIEVELK